MAASSFEAIYYDIPSPDAKRSVIVSAFRK